MAKVYVCYTWESDGEYGYELKTNRTAFTDKQDAEIWVSEINKTLSQIDTRYKNEYWGTALEDWKKEWRVKDPYDMEYHGRDGYGVDSKTIRECHESWDKLLLSRKQNHKKFIQSLPAYKDGRINEETYGARYDELDMI